jgi:flagellar motor protein MotB
LLVCSEKKSSAHLHLEDNTRGILDIADPINPQADGFAVACVALRFPPVGNNRNNQSQDNSREETHESAHRGASIGAASIEAVKPVAKQNRTADATNNRGQDDAQQAPQKAQAPLWSR